LLFFGEFEVQRQELFEEIVIGAEAVGIDRASSGFWSL
jgi:hypothetical protein